MFLINRNSSFNYFYFKEWTRIAETQYQPGFISHLFQIWLGPSGSPTGQHLINRCLIQTDDITSVCRDRQKIRRFGMTNEPEKILRGECCSQRWPTCPTSEQHLPPRWRTREGLGSAILTPQTYWKYSPGLMGCLFEKVRGATRNLVSATGTQWWRIFTVQTPGLRGKFKGGL